MSRRKDVNWPQSSQQKLSPLFKGPTLKIGVGAILFCSECVNRQKRSLITQDARSKPALITPTWVAHGW